MLREVRKAFSLSNTVASFCYALVLPENLRITSFTYFNLGFVDLPFLFQVLHAAVARFYGPWGAHLVAAELSLSHTTAEEPGHN